MAASQLIKIAPVAGVHDPATDVASDCESEETVITDPEQILEAYWQLWQADMRADAPDATDGYLRDKVLRAYLFENERFEEHRRKMVQLIAAKPKAAPTVEESDILLMSPEEHDAHMRATLKPDQYDIWHAATNATPMERVIEVDEDDDDESDSSDEEEEEWSCPRPAPCIEPTPTKLTPAEIAACWVIQEHDQ